MRLPPYANDAGYVSRAFGETQLAKLAHLEYQSQIQSLFLLEKGPSMGIVVFELRNFKILACMERLGNNPCVAAEL